MADYRWPVCQPHHLRGITAAQLALRGGIEMQLVTFVL